MNTTSLLFFASLLLVSAVNTAHAFDGRRAGFQAGIGLGAHTSTVNNDSSFAPSTVEAEQKLAVDFHVGYGFSNRIIGILGVKGGAIVVDGREGSLAIGGVGATLYWSDSAPSLYLTGLIGIGSLSMDDEDADLTDTGEGWMAGVGFEVARGLHLELSYSRADVVDPDNELNESALESAFATLKYVWY